MLKCDNVDTGCLNSDTFDPQSAICIRCTNLREQFTEGEELCIEGRRFTVLKIEYQFILVEKNFSGELLSRHDAGKEVLTDKGYLFRVLETQEDKILKLEFVHPKDVQ